MFKMTISMGICTLSKTNSSPLKISLPTRKGASPFHTIFQGFLLLVSGREYMCFIYTRCAPYNPFERGEISCNSYARRVKPFIFVHSSGPSMSKLQPSRSLIFPQPRLNITANTFGPLSAHFLTTVERSSRSEVTLLEASVASLGRFRTTEGLL